MHLAFPARMPACDDFSCWHQVGMLDSLRCSAPFPLHSRLHMKPCSAHGVSRLSDDTRECGVSLESQVANRCNCRIMSAGFFCRRSWAGRAITLVSVTVILLLGIGIAGSAQLYREVLVATTRSNRWSNATVASMNHPAFGFFVPIQARRNEDTSIHAEFVRTTMDRQRLIESGFAAYLHGATPWVVPVSVGTTWFL